VTPSPLAVPLPARLFSSFLSCLPVRSLVCLCLFSDPRLTSSVVSPPEGALLLRPYDTCFFFFFVPLFAFSPPSTCLCGPIICIGRYALVPPYWTIFFFSCGRGYVGRPPVAVCDFVNSFTSCFSPIFGFIGSLRSPPPDSLLFFFRAHGGRSRDFLFPTFLRQVAFFPIV